MADESRLEQIAAAVLDGTAVDWTAPESVQGTQPSHLKNLRAIAALAAVHRSHAMPAFGSWGHLRLLERIGRGAFGEVYRAWDTRLDREVALKLLPAPDAKDGLASSIIHEGRLLARVKHPNVVTIYGAEQIDDRIGLWMEFVPGHTLEQVVAEKGVFTGTDTARVGIEICRAVSAVHHAGLLHRDIKAHNVVLADDGRVVLMDFGTGQELGNASSTDLAGTPLYLAPEVLQGDAATVQSDIYSLGILLFRLISGSYPVQANTTRDLRLAHERNQRTTLTASHPEVPGALVRVIERATAPLAERRYQTADALCEDLVKVNQRRGVPWFYAAAAAVVVLGGWLALSITDRKETDGNLTTKHPVIAVLPFENLSNETDSEQFADGLTYEIHRYLAGIDGLELRSATSSFAFKNKRRDLSHVDKQLDVDYVLEGSILKSGNTLRVSPRLTRVADDTTVWANTFDREVREVFATLDDISLATVNALRLKLGRGQRRYETDPELYSQFLTARGLRARRHPDNSRQAADIFEAIVAKDPSFAPAWAGLASAASDATRLARREEPQAIDPRMEPAALKAIQIDPLLAEAQAAMGSVYGRRRDWKNAQRSFLTALELNPALTTTHTDFVLNALLPMGRVSEALHLLEEARRLDPLSLDVRTFLVLVQTDAERYKDAIESSQWVLAQDPDYPYAQLWLGRALSLAGRTDEALRILASINAQGRNPYLAYLYAVTGRRDEAEAILAKNSDFPYRQMFIYAGLRDKDRAFEALERAVDQNWWRAATWMIRPEMGILRGDPRVADLRKKMGLPPMDKSE